MNRRDFLKKTALAGAGLALPGSLTFVECLRAAQWPDLAVVRGVSPGDITREAVGILGGMGRFVSRGDVVVVKPNIGWDRPPDMAANTNPEVVAAVVRMCLDAGARRVKVFDHTVNDPRRCYRQSGIGAAARRAGAEVSYINKRRFVPVKIDGITLKEWPLYRDILEADSIINVPVAKTHGTSRLTMGMKNLMGVMGGWRFRIHQRIDESLVDIAGAIRPSLTLIDAVRIIVSNGPQGGRPGDVKRLDTVIAGADQVAVDAYGATLFGLTGRDLGYVRLGHETGLGNMDLSRLAIRDIRL